jgi:toxin ParE1/3/4
MLPILRTRRADEDLIEIWSWIAADSPAAADRVLDAIEARWSQLARYPQSGMARDDIAPGVRVLSAGQYLTLYRIDGSSVTILRVLHGKRRVGEQDVG